MNSTVMAAVIAAGVIGGGVSGFVAAQVAGPAPQAAQEDPEVAFLRDTTRDQKQEIDRLQSRLKEMQGTVQDLAQTNVLNQVRYEDLSDAYSELRAQVDTLGSAPAASAQAGDGAAPVPDAIQQAVAQELERREEQRRQERQERRGQMRDRMADRVAERLGLTEFQKTETSKIFETNMEKMRDLWRNAREGGDVDRDAMRQQMQQLRTEMETQLQGVLTPEQFKELQGMADGGFGGFFGGGRGGNRRGGGNNRDFQ